MAISIPTFFCIMSKWLNNDDDNNNNKKNIDRSPHY